MKTETQNSALLSRFLGSIVERLFPRALQKDYMESLDEYSNSPLDFLWNSALMIPGGFGLQVVAAFNKVAFAAELGAVFFCFAAAKLPLPFFAVLVAILGALILRDAYTHPKMDFSGRTPPADGEREQGQEFRYYMDSAGDAATAAILLFVSQALLLKISPTLAMPATILHRAAFICLPLLATLRMVLRPGPNPKMPFQSSKRSAEAITRMTWGLNIAWLVACCGSVGVNVALMPCSIPGVDFLRGVIPLLTFGVWRNIQADGLARRNFVETMFGDWKTLRLSRMRENLPKGMDKQDSLYLKYLFLQTLFFVELSLPSALALWPWLSGRAPAINFYWLGFNLSFFATLLLSWNYLKSANRAAAFALEKEIARRKAVPTAEPAV